MREGKGTTPGKRAETLCGSGRDPNSEIYVNGKFKQGTITTAGAEQDLVLFLSTFGGCFSQILVLRIVEYCFANY